MGRIIQTRQRQQATQARLSRLQTQRAQAPKKKKTVQRARTYQEINIHDPTRQIRGYISPQQYEQQAKNLGYQTWQQVPKPIRQKVTKMLLFQQESRQRSSRRYTGPVRLSSLDEKPGTLTGKNIEKTDRQLRKESKLAQSYKVGMKTPKKLIEKTYKKERQRKTKTLVAPQLSKPQLNEALRRIKNDKSIQFGTMGGLLNSRTNIMGFLSQNAPEILQHAKNYITSPELYKGIANTLMSPIKGAAKLLYMPNFAERHPLTKTKLPPKPFVDLGQSEYLKITDKNPLKDPDVLNFAIMTTLGTAGKVSKPVSKFLEKTIIPTSAALSTTHFIRDPSPKTLGESIAITTIPVATKLNPLEYRFGLQQAIKKLPANKQQQFKQYFKITKQIDTLPESRSPNLNEVEIFRKNKKAAAVFKEWLQQHPEVILGGSVSNRAQAPTSQLKNMRLPQDADLYVPNGQSKMYIKYLYTKLKPYFPELTFEKGGGLKVGNTHGVGVHDHRRFQQMALEAQGLKGIFPKIFGTIKSTDGITLIDMRLQAQRKLIGAMMQRRRTYDIKKDFKDFHDIVRNAKIIARQNPKYKSYGYPKLKTSKSSAGLSYYFSRLNQKTAASYYKPYRKQDQYPVYPAYAPAPDYPEQPQYAPYVGYPPTTPILSQPIQTSYPTYAAYPPLDLPQKATTIIPISKRKTKTKKIPFEDRQSIPAYKIKYYNKKKLVKISKPTINYNKAKRKAMWETDNQKYTRYKIVQEQIQKNELATTDNRLFPHTPEYKFGKGKKKTTEKKQYRHDKPAERSGIDIFDVMKKLTK